MEKDFDNWNEKKKNLNENVNRLFFHEGEIWWVHLGVNIGYEIDGKSSEFSRPVLILKKYNKFSFLALPLSSIEKRNKYWLFVGVVDSRDAYGNLSQLRNIDSKRLINKVKRIQKDELSQIKEKASEVNLSWLFLFLPTIVGRAKRPSMVGIIDYGLFISSGGVK